MEQEKLRDMLEEVRECDSIAELGILAELLGSGERGPGADAVRGAIEARRIDLESRGRTMEQGKVQIPEDVPGLREYARRLLAELEEERGKKARARERVLLPRIPRSYRLLKVDVSWTTKPQVRGLMRILEANFRIGEVVSEADIVAAVVANREILHTTQPPKRIWDYYKGDHMDGLQMHGNVEKL